MSKELQLSAVFIIYTIYVAVVADNKSQHVKIASTLYEHKFDDITVQMLR